MICVLLFQCMRIYINTGLLITYMYIHTYMCITLCNCGNHTGLVETATFLLCMLYNIIVAVKSFPHVSHITLTALEFIHTLYVLYLEIKCRYV